MNDNVPAPYLYNKYNITSHYTTKTTLLKNSPMQSLNSFIEGINKHRLPKHIIFMPDRDLLSPLRYKNRPGTSKAIGKLLRWITTEIERIIETKKESMFKICAGLVQGKQPNLIWVKALEVPRISYDSLLLHEKFNAILEETISNRYNSYILELQGLRSTHFDFSHHLMTEGKEYFWRDINSQIADFDEGSDHMQPPPVVTLSRGKTHHDYPTGHRKLPTPPLTSRGSMKKY